MTRNLLIAFIFILLLGSFTCGYVLCAKASTAPVVQGNISYDPFGAKIDSEFYIDVKSAVENATDGDIIEVYKNQNISSSILIDKNISLKATENVTLTCRHCGIKNLFQVCAGKIFSLGGEDSSQITLEGKSNSQSSALVNNSGTFNICENVVMQNYCDDADGVAVNGGDVNVYGGEILDNKNCDIHCDNFFVFGNVSIGSVSYNSNFYLSNNANLKIDKIEQASSDCQVPVLLGTLTNKTALVLFSNDYKPGTKIVECSQSNTQQILSNLTCDTCDLEISGGNLVVAGGGSGGEDNPVDDDDNQPCLILLECEDLEVSKSYTSWQDFWNACTEGSSSFDEDIMFDSCSWTITLSGNITVDKTLFLLITGGTDNTITIICAENVKITANGLKVFHIANNPGTQYMQIQKNGNNFQIDGTEICSESDMKKFIEYSTNLEISFT